MMLHYKCLQRALRCPLPACEVMDTFVTPIMLPPRWVVPLHSKPLPFGEDYCHGCLAIGANSSLKLPVVDWSSPTKRIVP